MSDTISFPRNSYFEGTNNKVISLTMSHRPVACAITNYFVGTPVACAITNYFVGTKYEKSPMSSPGRVGKTSVIFFLFCFHEIATSFPPRNSISRERNKK